MRKYAVLAAAAGMALAGVAKADFVVTDNVTHSGGNDIHTFQVVNNGLNGTGSKLLAVDATLQAFQGAASATATPNGTLKLMTYDAQQGAGSGAIDDLDVSNITNGSNDRSFVRAGSPTQWTIVSTNPGYESPDDGDPIATNMNSTAWGTDTANPQTITLSQVHVVGAVNLLGGGIADSTPKTFAVAIVPAGEGVRAFGALGSDVTPAPVAFDTLVPEPTSLSLLGLGLGALVVRRRRA